MKRFYVYIFLIASLSFIAIFHGLGKGNLADWDEAVYGEVSKEILYTGDWVTLHYKFQPWFHKPPLFLYLVSAAYKFFGISTFTSRLWPAILGIAAILVTFFLAKEIAGQDAAFISSLILITSPQFIHTSRLLMLDIPVTFFIVLSIYLFVLTLKRNSVLLSCLLGVSLGLGVMVKGVIGLIPFSIILSCLFFTKNLSYIKSKYFLAAFLLFLIVTLPWHLNQLLLHKARFFNDYLGYHVLRRVSEPLETHDYGNLYYFRVLKYGLKIWLYPLILSLIYLMVPKSKNNRANILLLSWIVITFGIFLIAKTKLPWYLIPLYPAFAIAVASFLSDINLNGIRIGFIISIAIFIVSFRIPQSCYGNNALNNINLIAGTNLRAHNSIPDQPGQLFYLGTERYSDEELIKVDSLYAAQYNEYEKKFAGYKIIYADEGYILFSKNDFKITKILCKIPQNQKSPLRFCYSYMPFNLGYRE